MNQKLSPTHSKNGTEGRTRTGTAFATAPSRRRVYQFHHFGMTYILSLVSGGLTAGIGTEFIGKLIGVGIACLLAL